ncbi:MAG: prefoldin subunit [Candidatus Aenigmarchaeota archaeon]|nr:prefoldin subunit [Candidatus Aenigmarchaeota archaeon]
MPSKQEQQMLAQAQVYQQQMQMILAQRETLDMQQKEIENALVEMKKTKEKEVYKIAGTVLVKDSKVAVIKDLSGKKKLIDTQLKRLEINEKRIKEKVDELVNKVKS